MSEVTIEVNKNLELMNIIILTGRYNEILNEMFGFNSKLLKAFLE